MSIKSQNSLNEECSETFEKSYSVRSSSEESLNNDDDECLVRELLDKLSPGALSRLRRRFRRAGGKGAADAADRVEQAMHAAAQLEGVQFATRAAPPAGALCLREDAFVEAIDEIFGRNRYSVHARRLCLALDPLRSGRVLWHVLLDRLLPPPAPAPAHAPARALRPVPLAHCQRECIVRMVSVERAGTFCYVAVTRGGRAGVYSGELQLLFAYQVFQGRAGAGAGGRRRVRTCWVTDAVYIAVAACVAYATSERCVRVFAAPTPAHAPLHCVSGLPDLPTCLAYSPCEAGGGKLAVGTARGTLCMLHFLRPRAALLPQATDAPSYHSWTELCSGAQRAYCSARVVTSHSRAVRRLMCERDARRVLSCSHDAACSLRVRHASQHLDDYIFKVPRGVSCFHAVGALRLVASGSGDGAVRLWGLARGGPYALLSQPAAAPLLDVAVLARAGLVVAFHNDCTLNIWDLHEECLLQSIKIKFPFLGVLGKKAQFGACCIHPGPARKPESTEDPPLESSKRRGSQVYRGSSGGLLLEDSEEAENGYTRDLKSDPECIRFDRPDLLITCCDHVCVVRLGGGARAAGALLPPPRDTLQARRPSYWELPEDFISTIDNVPAAGREEVRQPAAPRDLDRLLETAGLRGLLEKDFVLMQGLKNDLNRKLNDLKTDMDASRRAVRSGAPHLALRPLSPPPAPAPRGSLSDYCARLTLEFPPPSLVATPSGSAGSSSRHSRAAEL